jgi:hypothetical protein
MVMSPRPRAAGPIHPKRREMNKSVKSAAAVVGGLTILLGVALAGLTLILVLTFAGAPAGDPYGNVPSETAPANTGPAARSTSAAGQQASEAAPLAGSPS